MKEAGGVKGRRETKNWRGRNRRGRRRGRKRRQGMTKSRGASSNICLQSSLEKIYERK